MKTILAILSGLMLLPQGVRAMNRLSALSQIESRNNDRAIGRQQEVSRYQILPEFWQQAKVAWRPTDPVAAGTVVNVIMQARCQAFRTRYHRAPDDFEYYILWHRPACLIGRPVVRPLTALERERGRRFASLCANG